MIGNRAWLLGFWLLLAWPQLSASDMDLAVLLNDECRSVLDERSLTLAQLKQLQNEQLRCLKNLLNEQRNELRELRASLTNSSSAIADLTTCSSTLARWNDSLQDALNSALQSGIRGWIARYRLRRRTDLLVGPATCLTDG